MQVEDRSIFAERHLIEERNCQSKLLVDELAVTKPHRDDEVIPVDQCFGQRLWNVCGRVGSFLDQPVGNDGVDCLGVGFDSRRFDSVERLLTELRPQRKFSRHTSENITGTHKKNRLHQRLFVRLFVHSFLNWTVDRTTMGRLQSCHDRPACSNINA